MIRSLALIRPVPVNPSVLDHSALVNHHVVNLAGLPGERRPVHAGVVVRAERVVKCDRTVVQFSLQISRDKLRILNPNLNKNSFYLTGLLFSYPSSQLKSPVRKTLLPGLLCCIMVSVMVMADPSNWSPLHRHR